MTRPLEIHSGCIYRCLKEQDNESCVLLKLYPTSLRPHSHLDSITLDTGKGKLHPITVRGNRSGKKPESRPRKMNRTAPKNQSRNDARTTLGETTQMANRERESERGHTHQSRAKTEATQEGGRDRGAEGRRRAPPPRWRREGGNRPRRTTGRSPFPRIPASSHMHGAEGRFPDQARSSSERAKRR